jgi:quinol monooxygenase YgiN
VANDAAPVFLHAQFTSVPGEEEQVAELIREYGEKVVLEDGQELFEVYRESEHPGTFFVWERYRDQAAFQGHISTEDGRLFNAALTPLIVGSGSTVTFLTPV